MTTTTPTGNHGGALVSCSPYAHLALPKSVLCIELGPQRPVAHCELAYLIKKVLYRIHICVKTTRKTFDPKEGWEGLQALAATLALTLIKTEYWDRAGEGGNISYDW